LKRRKHQKKNSNGRKVGPGRERNRKGNYARGLEKVTNWTGIQKGEFSWTRKGKRGIYDKSWKKEQPKEHERKGNIAKIPEGTILRNGQGEIKGGESLVDQKNLLFCKGVITNTAKDQHEKGGGVTHIKRKLSESGAFGKN